MSKDTRDIDDADNMDGDMRAVDEEIVMLLPPYHKGQIGIFVMVVFLFCAHGKNMLILGIRSIHRKHLKCTITLLLHM